MTEADTCREFVTPKLVEAGWGAAGSVIGEQHSFTNGRIIVAGGKVRRGKQRRADYLLYYRRDFPLAVVEAKEFGLPAETGVQQARDYAEMLGLKFAYATNGHRIIEIDYTAGTEREVDRYATPHELWQRLTASAHLTEPAAAHLHPAWAAAHTGHAGDGHGQDLHRFPDLLEALEQPLEPHGRVPASQDPVPRRSQHPGRNRPRWQGRRHAASAPTASARCRPRRC